MSILMSQRKSEYVRLQGNEEDELRELENLENTIIVGYK